MGRASVESYVFLLAVRTSHAVRVLSMVRVFFTALLLYVRKMNFFFKVRACLISTMRAKIRTDCLHY